MAILSLFGVVVRRSLNERSDRTGTLVPTAPGEVTQPAKPAARWALGTGPFAKSSSSQLSKQTLEERREHLAFGGVQLVQKGLGSGVAGGQDPACGLVATRGKGHCYGTSVASGAPLDEADHAEFVDQTDRAGGGEADDLSELVDRRPTQELVQGHQRCGGSGPVAGRRLLGAARPISDPERQNGEQVRLSGLG